MDAQTIEAMASSVSKLWPMVYGALGAAVAAGAGAGALMLRVRNLEKGAQAERVKHAELERRVNARLYHPDGSVIYCSMEECRRYRAACTDAIEAQVNEIKRMHEADETTREQRHNDIQKILMQVVGALGKAGQGVDL